jgi:hypothetical protein
MKKSDIPKEAVAIEKEIRKFATYGKLNCQQWKSASWQLYKNRNVGFRTLNYIVENPQDRGQRFRMRFGWNENLELYAVATSSMGKISYYGPYMTEKEFKKYKDKSETIVIKISHKPKKAYKAVLAEKGLTMQDDLMGHIIACIRGNRDLVEIVGSSS